MARRLHDHRPLADWSVNVSPESRVCEFLHGDDVEDVALFSGKLMLPTKLQVLKLHLFLRDEAGKKNRTVSQGNITSKVVKIVMYYQLLEFSWL